MPIPRPLPAPIALSLSLALGLVACDLGGKDSGDTTEPDTHGDTDTGADTDTDPASIDADGDGYTPDGGDCNDADGAVSPSAPEVCDEVDNNCDGAVDEGVTATFYADTDGDGFGDPDLPHEGCTAPSGHVEDHTDCDDGRDSIHPAAAEVCDPDNLDEDCDTLADDADPSATGQTPFYPDADGDGFGNTEIAVLACDVPVGHVADSQDCNDDYSDSANPEARCWNTTWTGTIRLTFTVPALGISDVCTGTASLPIDLSSSPMIDGTATCAASALGLLSLAITGDIDASDTITGDVDTGYFSAAWTGTIADSGLSGTASGSDSSSGFLINYTMSLSATR